MNGPVTIVVFADPMAAERKSHYFQRVRWHRSEFGSREQNVLAALSTTLTTNMPLRRSHACTTSVARPDAGPPDFENDVVGSCRNARNFGRPALKASEAGLKPSAHACPIFLL